MKARRTFVATLLVLCLTGCGNKPSSTDSPKTDASKPDATKLVFTAEHQASATGQRAALLTVQELDGPAGSVSGEIVRDSASGKATIINGKLLPGKYVVKGSYDLGKTKIGRAKIRLKFEGHWYFDKQFTQDTFLIPDGQSAGTFELSQGVKEWVKGIGWPVVELRDDQQVYDTVGLRIVAPAK